VTNDFKVPARKRVSTQPRSGYALNQKENLVLLTPAAGIPMSVARAKNQRTPPPASSSPPSTANGCRWWRWRCWCGRLRWCGIGRSRRIPDAT